MHEVQKSEKTCSEELADTLIAISVVAKRIASKLQTKNQEGGKSDVKNGRTVGSA